MKETPIGDKASESPVRQIFIFGRMRDMASTKDATHVHERRRYVDNEKGLTDTYIISNIVLAPPMMTIVRLNRIKFLTMVMGDDAASSRSPAAFLYRICRFGDPDPSGYDRDRDRARWRGCAEPWYWLGIWCCDCLIFFPFFLPLWCSNR